MARNDLVLLGFLVIPIAGLTIPGLYLAWQRWQIFQRIGRYSMGFATFIWQLDYPGLNFPGPNVLEVRIAAQSADLQVHIAAVRRRVRYLRRATLLYGGYAILTVFLFRKFGP